MSNRNADAVTESSKDGIKYFVKPLEKLETFEEFLDYVQLQECQVGGATDVKYAQTREPEEPNEMLLLTIVR